MAADKAAEDLEKVAELAETQPYEKGEEGESSISEDVEFDAFYLEDDIDITKER